MAEKNWWKKHSAFETDKVRLNKAESLAKSTGWVRPALETCCWTYEKFLQVVLAEAGCALHCITCYSWIRKPELKLKSYVEKFAQNSQKKTCTRPEQNMTWLWCKSWVRLQAMMARNESASAVLGKHAIIRYQCCVCGRMACTQYTSAVITTQSVAIYFFSLIGAF